MPQETLKSIDKAHCQSCGGIVGQDCGSWEGYTSCCNERVVGPGCRKGDCSHGEWRER